MERGEAIVVTGRGRPIAPIVLEARELHQGSDRAVAAIRTFRKRTGRITVAELLSARHAGHK